MCMCRVQFNSSVHSAVVAGVLGTRRIVCSLLKARGEGESRPLNQVTQVTVVGAIVEDSIPSL